VDGLSPADARALIRPTVDLAAALVRSRGFGTEELSAVLIAGAEGTVGTYVSDLLAAVFPAPVLRDPQPRMTVALGAALAGRPAVPVNPQAVSGGPTDAFAILPAGHHVAVRADVR
jgi:molecular chaperone DnaK (HSP70)